MKISKSNKYKGKPRKITDTQKKYLKEPLKNWETYRVLFISRHLASTEKNGKG